MLWGSNLFKTFIKVKYSLSGKILFLKSYHWGTFLLPSQYLSLFPDEKFSLRFNEYI